MQNVTIKVNSILSLHLLAFCGLVCICYPVSAQTFKVVVKDALNGKPQAGVQVEYFCEGRPNEGILNGPNKELVTDSLGASEIPFQCGYSRRIEIYVLAPRSKEECGSLEPKTLKEISTVGVISDPTSAGNIWCPTKISRRLTPIPGEVIIFVKKPTWYQSHVAG